jgi:predicted nucleotidyltransferase
MKKMKMLELERLDLEELCHALEDHSGFSKWFIDTKTGKLHMFGDGMWDGEDVGRDFEPPDECRRIDPIDSAESYDDLAEFTAMVRDIKTRDLLERAIAGRGAFRRFKDALANLPDLRAAWFKFHDARLERRAIEWLRDESLISDKDADRGIGARPDPQLPAMSKSFDVKGIARDVTHDLRGLYGERLRNVILYGSWARGDAHPESDIDLLVVLDRFDNAWKEHARMSDILDKHSLDNDTVVSALVVTEQDYAVGQRPVLARVRAEGQPIA